MIWLAPPPGLVAAAAALPRPEPGGSPAGRLTGILAAGAAGAYAWALDGPEAGRRVWGEQAQLGLGALEVRLEHAGADTDRFTLASQVSAVAQWAWLAGDPAGRHALDHAGSRCGWASSATSRWPVPRTAGAGGGRHRGPAARPRQPPVAPGGPLLGTAARLLRALVHPAMGPPWPPAAALDAQRRLAITRRT